MRLLLGVASASLLGTACQISGASVPSLSVADAKPTAKATATPTASLTSTRTPPPTATATNTPEPTATPTPFGGTGLEFIYTRLDSSLVRYGQEPVLTREQVLERLRREFEYIWFYPSSDLSAVVIRGFTSGLPAPHWYLAPIDLSEIRPFGSGNFAFKWSPDGSRLLVIQGNSMYLYRKDGKSGFQIGTRGIKDSIPSWSPDSASLYLTRNGKFRVIDAATGRSETLETDLPDEFFIVHNLEFSPSGKRVAFHDNEWPEGRKVYIANSDFTDPVVVLFDQEDELHSSTSALYWLPTEDALVAYVTTNETNCSTDCAKGVEYYLVDVSSATMSRLRNLERGIQNLNPGRIINCGLTPDGRNFVGFHYGTYYFFDLITGEIARQLESPFTCPLWLQDD